MHSNRWMRWCWLANISAQLSAQPSSAHRRFSLFAIMDSFWFLSTFCFSTSSQSKSQHCTYSYTWIRSWYIWMTTAFSSQFISLCVDGDETPYWNCFIVLRLFTTTVCHNKKWRFPLLRLSKTKIFISKRHVNFMTLHLPFCLFWSIHKMYSFESRHFVVSCSIHRKM